MMNRVFVSAAGLLLSATAFAAPFELKGTAAKGVQTYKTMCASCHGDSGAGDGVAAAALNPKPASFVDAKRAAAATDEYVYKMIRDGGAANGKSPLMVSWKASLSDEQIRDVAAFVRSLSKPSAAAPAPAAAPRPAKK